MFLKTSKMPLTINLAFILLLLSLNVAQQAQDAPRLERTITWGPPGSNVVNPTGLAVDEKAGLAYVASCDTGNLAVVNLRTRQVNQAVLLDIIGINQSQPDSTNRGPAAGDDN
jgi:hypothetical protein